jgi:hypothetical protein
MRRLALSLMASCGLAMLAACSGGTGFSGSGNSTNPSIDGIYFTNGSGQVNDFFLAAAPNAPLAIYAVAYKGSGATNNVVPGVTYTWNANYAPTTQQYYKGTSPNGATNCAAAPSGAAPVASILQQGPGGQPYGPVLSPVYGSTYTQLQDQSNPLGAAPNYKTNAPNYVTQTDHVFFAPPLVLAADGTQTATPQAAPYCINLFATAVGSGVQGKVTIVVSNSP